jgi:hypothetical protein
MPRPRPPSQLRLSHMMRNDHNAPGLMTAEIRRVIVGALEAVGGVAYYRATGARDDSKGATFVIGRVDAGAIRYSSATFADVKDIPAASMVTWNGLRLPKPKGSPGGRFPR